MKESFSPSLTEQIDWISFTLPANCKQAWPDKLEKVFTITKSFNGYDTAQQFHDGRIQLSSSVRPEMGIHCVMSGVPCNNNRENLREIIENVWAQKGKVTRIDIALDDHTGQLNPRIATEYIQKGEYKCRAKEYPIDSDAKTPGYSQYMGKMASETHLCLYEKFAEKGEYSFRCRIEIRYKGKKANKAAREYLSSEDCRGLILGFAKFPKWVAWNDIFKTKPIQVASEKTESKRVIWLLTQCAKSMALEISESEGDMRIMGLFQKAVGDFLADLRHNQDEKTED